MQKGSNPTIFHFNCPVCGSYSAEKDLRLYLKRWQNVLKEEAENLLIVFTRILKNLKTSKLKWFTKRFIDSITREIELLESIIERTKLDDDENLIIRKNDKLMTLFDCPLCGLSKGERMQGNYFSEWQNACKVQVANVLYEVGIVVFAIARSLPQWASPEYLGVIGKILKANRISQESLGLMECHFCGRFTNALSGEGTKDNPYRCRWCVDRAGGIGIVIKFNFNEEDLKKYSIDDEMLKAYIGQNFEFLINQGIPDKPLPKDIIPF